MSRVAEVVWLDAAVGHGGDVGTIRRSWPVRSVGWVVRRDSEGILLAHSKGPDGLIDFTNIPEACVLRVSYLKRRKER